MLVLSVAIGDSMVTNTVTSGPIMSMGSIIGYFSETIIAHTEILCRGFHVKTGLVDEEATSSNSVLHFI